MKSPAFFSLLNSDNFCFERDHRKLLAMDVIPSTRRTFVTLAVPSFCTAVADRVKGSADGEHHSSCANEAGSVETAVHLPPFGKG